MLLRIYFPKITVTVAVLKFGWINWITIIVAVLASAVTPHFHWFPITILKVIWINFPRITVTVTVLKCFWIRKAIIRIWRYNVRAWSIATSKRHWGDILLRGLAKLPGHSSSQVGESCGTEEKEEGADTDDDDEEVEDQNHIVQREWDRDPERISDSRSSRKKKAHKHYNLLGPLQGSFGPFGPEIPKKSKKSCWGLSAPGSKKVEKKSKKVEKVEKRLFLTRFWPFFDFFSTFFDPGASRPRQLFFDPFWDFGPEGPEWPL